MLPCLPKGKRTGADRGDAGEKIEPEVSAQQENQYAAEEVTLVRRNQVVGPWVAVPIASECKGREGNGEPRNAGNWDGDGGERIEHHFALQCPAHIVCGPR
jgi:hypothetical protein